MRKVLLPFQFSHLEDDFLITNIVGEHAFLSKVDFKNLISGDYETLSESAALTLESRHFLVQEDNQELVEKMLAIKLRSRKNYLEYFTSLHMVVLTLRCNCCCDYCHASSKDMSINGVDMDTKTASAVLNCILESPSNDIKIEFQGGEPTLNWDTLKFIVLEGEKRIKKQSNRQLSFVVCTNLMDVSDEQLAFYKDHHVDISTSCDGPQYYHDLHRKARDGTSSYVGFKNNLDRVRKEMGFDSVSALLTVTNDNLPHLKEIINHYDELGFKNIFIRALNPYGYAQKNEASLSYSTEEFLMYYKQALEYILEMNKSGKFFIESYAALLFQRIMTPFSTGFVDLQSPSGAGIAGAIYYYNGDVYPADEARMLATMGDIKFKMGNVLRDNYMDIFNSRVLQNLVWNSCVEILPECTSCVFSPHCGSDPIRYYVESKDIVGKRPSSEFCKKNKGIFNILFKLIQEKDQENMAILWSWTQHRPLEEWMSCGR